MRQASTAARAGFGVAIALALALVAAITLRSATPAPSPPAKPPVTGVYDRQHFPDGPEAGHTITTRIADLVPVPNGELDLAEVDRVQSELDARARVPGATVMLRVQWGNDVGSAWLDQFGSYESKNPSSGGGTVAVPRFWTPEFKAAKRDAIAKIAARFDAHPALRATVIGGATSVFSEPMLLQLGDRQTRRSIVAAGYTNALGAEAIKQDIRDHRDLWVNTISSLAYSPYQQLADDDSYAGPSAEAMEGIMEYQAEQLGLSRAQFANNSVGDCPNSFLNHRDPDYRGMYQALKDKRDAGHYLVFQTETWAKLSSPGSTDGHRDLICTIETAANEMGAHMVEEPAGNTLTPAEYAQLNPLLASKVPVREG